MIGSDAHSLINTYAKEGVYCRGYVGVCLIDIWYLANQFREVEFSFVPRGGNLAALVVASHVACHGSSFLWDVLGPDFLFKILAEDINVSIRL